MSPEWKAKIEQCLSEYSLSFVPDGSTEKAVIHQWIHALSQGLDIYGSQSGASEEEIISILQKNNLYNSKNQFSKDVRENVRFGSVRKSSFRFIDLFAGIGGMRLGFESCGGKCVFSSEFEKNAQKTYEDNHGEYPFGDITRISEKDIPEHDVLVGGFPCQAFSHAGLKRGIEDTRGTLFYDIARIIKRKKPKALLLENVKGLISHEGGLTLKTILNTLIDEGYRCIIPDKIIKGDDIELLKNRAKEMVLRSCDFGVPQNRQRIYIVLWRQSLDIDFKYPEKTNKETFVGQILEPTPDDKYTISDRLWEGHQRRKKQNVLNGKGFGFGLVKDDSPYTNTISARYYKDGSEILIDQENKNPRKLTPLEASRLQGFPDGFKINKSNAQAYKQFGNSVSVPVIEALAAAIKKQILSIGN